MTLSVHHFAYMISHSGFPFSPLSFLIRLSSLHLVGISLVVPHRSLTSSVLLFILRSLRVLQLNPVLQQLPSSRPVWGQSGIRAPPLPLIPRASRMSISVHIGSTPARGAPSPPLPPTRQAPAERPPGHVLGHQCSTRGPRPHSLSQQHPGSQDWKKVRPRGRRQSPSFSVGPGTGTTKNSGSS